MYNNKKSGLRKKAEKKIILIALSIFGPMVLLLFGMMILILIIGGPSSLLPSMDDEQQNEFKRVASYCGISWDEFIAYLTVRYENNFEGLNPEDVALDFMTIDYKVYKKVKVAKPTKVVVPDELEEEVEEEPEGEKPKGEEPEEYWELDYTGVLETRNAIIEFSRETGGPTTEATKIVDHLRYLGNSERYDFYFGSKEMKDFFDEMTAEQQEWYSTLISENLIKMSLGEVYELPDNIVVETDGFFAYPAPGVVRISSPFGWRTDPVYGNRQFHKGIDIAGPVGTPIITAASGTVVSTSYKTTGYGYSIVVEHMDNDNNVWQTRYSHLSQIEVEPGDVVERGKVIAAMGNTGKSTGPHLHFEILFAGTPVDPLLFVKPQ